MGHVERQERQERMDLQASPELRDHVVLLDHRERGDSLVYQAAVVQWERLDLVDLLDPVVKLENRESLELLVDLVCCL